MANAVKTQTSTQIRNMYSDDMSYMNIKFFNLNLSFQLYPFLEKTQDGRSKYDMKNGLQTTVTYEGAAALFKACQDIIDNKVSELTMSIECYEATLRLEYKMSATGQYDTVLILSKKNTDIPFKFKTHYYTIKENGQVITKIVPSGLITFAKILDAYMSGINADRHLDKLTDDYANLQNTNKTQRNPIGGTTYQQQYRPYNNPPQQYSNTPQFGQNMSTFTIPQ